MVFFNTTLETKRLVLRGFNQQSYDELFGSADDFEISKILGISTDEELELEKFRYKGGYSTYNLTIQFFQLVAKEDNRILGWCGYHSWAKQHRRAEIFYMLKNDDDKRKGLMSEALERVLEYGKTEMNLRRIEAFVATDNPASYKLVEKFGFQKEAEIQFRYQFGDEVDWDFMYALLLE
jgi:[ribosomal protein S5]-alanine N-acetyltransferase